METAGRYPMMEPNIDDEMISEEDCFKVIKCFFQQQGLVS